MYQIFTLLLEQQKKVKTMVIINLVLSGLLYLLLLMFSVRVLNTSMDGTSVSFAMFFLFISIFFLIDIIISTIVVVYSANKSKDFIAKLNKYLIDNNLVEQKIEDIKPEDIINLLKNSTDERDFQMALEKFLREIEKY